MVDNLNLSVVVIITDGVKAIANGAIEALGWHPSGGDSFYLGASSTGSDPATHWYMRTQAQRVNADLLEAIAAGEWPDTPPSWLTDATSWEDVGLTSRARSALTAGVIVDVQPVADIGRDYAGHVATVLGAAGLREIVLEI